MKARKTLPGEIGTYNPYTMEYEHPGTQEELHEDFQIEHEDDVNEQIFADQSDLKRGELLPPELQADTWDPYRNKFVKAGSPIDKGEDR